MPYLTRIVALLALLVSGLAQAQGGLTIDIVNGNPAALPITVVPFAYGGGALPPDTDIAQVMSGDFNRCGQFRALKREDVVEQPSKGSDIQFATWRQLKQDFIVVGRIQDGDQGAYRVEFELHDVAKGTQLLGVKVVVARSFERIHRSNLVGMGVLPCQFKGSDSVASLGIRGDEEFDLTGVETGIKPQMDVMLTIRRQDGSTLDVPLLLRIDTPIEVDYYLHGGILPFVLRELLAA